MTHPAGVTKKLWFGLEIEGSMAKRRVPTAFLACASSAQDLVRVLAQQHIFLTEDFEDWGWLALLVTCTSLPITVARRNDEAAVRHVLSLPYADKLTLMVRAMPTPWATLLRPQDQVSIGIDYDLLTFSVYDGVRTRPDEYKGDHE